MNEYGFLAYNKSDNVVIDSLFKNYVLVESGTTTLSTGYNYISIPNTSQTVAFAMKPTENAYVIHWGFVETGGLFTHVRVISSGNCTIDWVLFKSMAPRVFPEDAYGLAIYDDEGNLTFSSLENYMKIRKFYETTSSTIRPVDINNNYFITWSYISKAEYRYTQTGTSGQWVCDTGRWTGSNSGAITNNYVKVYSQGMKKSGNSILLDYVFMYEKELIPGATIKTCGSVVCSNGVTGTIICNGDSSLREEYTGNKMKLAEVLDPIR